jgi:hypothetical protein
VVVAVVVVTLKSAVVEVVLVLYIQPTQQFQHR